MKLNIDQIRDDGLELVYQEPATHFDYLKENDSGVSISTPVHVTLFARKSSEGVTIKGMLEGTVTLACSRCLKTFTEKIDHSFYYNCLSEREIVNEVELSLEDVDTCYFSGAEIDVTALIYEQAALAVPMKPICKEDCKGLCPKCGADLNEGNCKCPREIINRRFEALKSVKVKK